MKLNSRQAATIEMFERDKTLSIKELSARFGVSEMTIRRDFRVLERAGLITTSHGAGVSSKRLFLDMFSTQHSERGADAKKAIAAKAAEYTAPGDIMILDTGSTVFELSGHLRDAKGLTVATPSLLTALNLFASNAVKVILLGGYVRPWSPDLFGSMTERNIAELHFHKAFIGADGIDPEEGFFCADMNSANIVRRIIESSDQVFVLADSSKIGRKALVRYAGFEQVDRLITDDGGGRAATLGDRIAVDMAAVTPKR